MQNIKRFILLMISAALCLTALAGCAEQNNNTNPDNNPVKERVEDVRNLDPYDFTIMNLSGTDALGRRVSPSDGYRDDAGYVGMWYSFWEGQHPESQSEVRDVQKLLDMGEEGIAVLKDMSDVGQFYWWGEPLYGYYNSADPFVIARHIELFTMAGIDFICVDFTNTYDYVAVGRVFLDMLKQYKDQGFNVPKVCFYTNSNSGTTVNTVYRHYYAKGNWDDLWFKPNGKPLIIGITENNANASDQTKFGAPPDYVSAELQEYFEVKESQWPNGDENENGMPWMFWAYPESGITEPPILSGYVAVPVAQHDPITLYFSNLTPHSSRGFDNNTGEVNSDWREGQSFQQMWDSVIRRRDQVSTVMMCCWNEWMAQKQPNTGGFMDVYNWEYSRDLEMMKGGYGDNFYMQVVKNVRAFKYKDPASYIWRQKTIDIHDLSQWEDVTSHYKDFAGDAIIRDFKNCANTEKYTDDSARNDITDIKMIHDTENLYVYIKTVDDITEYNGTDENWMNILISTDPAAKDAFEGYQYLINRKPVSGKTSVEKSTGGYNWTSVGEADYTVNGNEMVFSIPLSALGLTADNVSIEFKVADHVTNYTDIMDYYVTGDCAPIGRLNFSYGY